MTRRSATGASVVIGGAGTGAFAAMGVVVGGLGRRAPPAVVGRARAALVPAVAIIWKENGVQYIVYTH